LHHCCSADQLQPKKQPRGGEGLRRWYPCNHNCRVSDHASALSLADALLMFTWHCAVLKGENPYLVVSHPLTDTRLRVWFLNEQGIASARLLAAYETCDPRVAPLLSVVLFWARRKKLFRGSTLSHGALR
jgi:hypothetical protein